MQVHGHGHGHGAIMTGSTREAVMVVRKGALASLLAVMSYRRLRPLRPRVPQLLRWATRRGNIGDKIFEMVLDVRPNGLSAADCSASSGSSNRRSHRPPPSSAEVSRLRGRLEDIRELDHRCSCVEAHEESGITLANLGAPDRLSHSSMAPYGRSVHERLSANWPP